MRKHSLNSMLLICIFAFAGLSATAQSFVQTTVEGGTIKGYESDGVTIFKGIPFAAPPLGNLRWKAPQPVVPWTGIRECIKPPASALQSKPVPFYCWSKEFLIPEEPISEDCLYLNVWSAAKSSTEKRPVIVWIHGGAFTGGSGTVPLYDGEAMARKDVVFVTINYRLGIMGFFVHPSLSAESPNKVSGNYGILDQIAALKWVKQNISKFGGDPDNVTIAGQSAGSFSVNVLVVSPLAKGLFHKAIAQSGGRFGKSSIAGQDVKEAEKTGIAFAEKLGAKSIEELRSMPAEKLMATEALFSLSFDNVVIPPIYETFAAGKQNDVSLLTGWNADDGVSFGPGAPAEKFKADAQKHYGNKAGEFLELFPANTDEEAQKSQKLLSQLSFGWSNYMWARMQNTTGKGKAYLYYFTHVPPGEPNYGAFHSAEFGYALHTLKFWDRPFTDVDYNLENIMSTYWVNFATTGTPNGKGLPEWPIFDYQNPKVIDLGDEVKAISLPNIKQIEFLNKANGITR